MKLTDKYLFFWNGIYSQWFPSVFKENEIKFIDAEHYMMYKKAIFFNDEKI